MSDNPPRPNSAFHTQSGHDDNIPSLNQKGEFVAIGSTSYVERSPNVKKKTWDPDEYILTLENMPNGTLKDYLESHFLHSSVIIHCDIRRHNSLLDACLRLKVIDFSGSSIDGSYTEISLGTRYAAPTLERSLQWTPTVKTDLISLGSTIYYIMMGKAPFEEFRSEDVQKMDRNREFPDLTGIRHADTI
ncbi:kinase-like domain-containing protein [Colletotrichum cereale]|nr:kinase-like domain-containing protein [Colletotrichum cereale]